MFWNKKNKDKKKPATTSTKKPSSEEIRAQALANAKAARENLGDDTIQKIAEIMKQKESSKTEQAKAQIRRADTDRVVDGIRDIMDED